MSRVLAFILCIALLAQNLARFSIAGVYELRKEFVAKNLCENRSTPGLNCCGKCVLVKELAKADERAGDSKNTPKKTEPPESAVVQSVTALVAAHRTYDCVSKSCNPAPNRIYSYRPRSGIFRPPRS